MLLIIHAIFAGLFVILGIMFLRGKGLDLIAGYNTTSKAEKEKIDKRKLCKYMGKLMFLLAGCFLILMASVVFDKLWLMWLGIVLFVCIAVGGVIYMNTGNRLKI